MKNKLKKPQMDWTDYDKLTPNQRAVLKAHKNLHDKKLMEQIENNQSQDSKNEKPLTRGQRILLQTMKKRKEGNS